MAAPQAVHRVVARTLAQKIALVVDPVRAAMAGLDGVVLSSGALQQQGIHPDEESALSPGLLAIRRTGEPGLAAQRLVCCRLADPA
jgi:hypothetical protein